MISGEVHVPLTFSKRVFPEREEGRINPILQSIEHEGNIASLVSSPLIPKPCIRLYGQSDAAAGIVPTIKAEDFYQHPTEGN